MNRENRLLIALGIAYALLYAFFYPPINTTMDESAYLNYAYVFRQGTLYADVAGISVVQSFTIGPANHVIALYPPGMPAILAVVSLFGWTAVLGMNLFVHLATFAVLSMLLRRIGISPLFALLYLLHPTAVIYSHTLMSDLLSGLILALVFWFCLSRRWWAAGLLLGLAVFVRTANVIAVPLFALGAAWDAIPAVRQGAWGESLRKLLPAITLALTALPLFGAAYGYQKVIQEGGWARYSGVGMVGLHHFPHMFPAYVIELLLIYPGMLLAPMLYRGPGRSLMLSVCYGFLLFYSCYFWQDSTSSRLESFVIGPRYLLAVLPLYLLAYAKILSTIRFPRIPAVLLATGTLVLFIGAGMILAKHQMYLNQLRGIRDAITANVPVDTPLFCNIHVAKLLHPAWTGRRNYITIGGAHDIPTDTREATREIAHALKGKATAYVAVWSRDYRSETKGEQAVEENIAATFKADELHTNIQGLRILRIVAPTMGTTP